MPPGSISRRASLALLALAASPGPTGLTLRAMDGLAVHGEATDATGPARAALLLFHQAGASAAEYAPIAPRLAAAGFDCLAIDQRAGGDMFGGDNLTADALHGRPVNFLDAFPDLEAAMIEAHRRWPGTRLIACGSSYSAALVFLLAARHPDLISAVIAFSPDEYLSGASVHRAAASLRCPIFVTSAADPQEEAAAAAILAASPSRLKVQYRPMIGIHGAATLRPDTDPQGSEACWTALLAFLSLVAPLPK
jgi:alpha-beta hydrolase superfamily lysophospholipase